MSGQHEDLKQLGRYELLELLGRGGMAEVYKARLPGALGFDKTVAVKRILPEARTNTEFVEMFVREARLCSRMMHPNLIQVFEFAETDGQLFLAMELVEGSDLRKVITAHKQLGKPLPLEFVTLLAQGVLRGLDGAHRLTDERGQSLNVVHRDLSPANVLLSYEGAIKVADFGVAHQSSTGDSDGSSIKGKLQYMAPEQLLGGEVDERVDVFAAGCVLYEMLSGLPVYAFGQTPEIIQRVSRGQYQPIEQVVPGIDPELASVVRRSLAANREQRFRDCATFATEISKLVQAGRLPCASGEDLGLYLQVLLPKQPFRIDLAHTPSSEDRAVILAGSIFGDGDVNGTGELDLVVPEPSPLVGSLLPDRGPAPLINAPNTAPIPDVDPQLAPNWTAPSSPRPPSGRPAGLTPPAEVRPRSAGAAVATARPPTGGPKPAAPAPQSASELDKMLRAYLEESGEAKDAEVPKPKSESKWLKWLK